jgi:hypothetical protein
MPWWGAVQVRCAPRRLKTGRVAVEGKRDVARDPRKCLQVLIGQCGSSGGDGVGKARLVGGSGVGVALDYDRVAWPSSRQG